MYKETYIYDRMWLYSDTEPITQTFPNRAILYSGKRDEIPFGILENHGYTSVYFKGETKIGEWVCIVLWNKEYAPVVLDSVISKSFWLHNVDASLIPECIYAAIKDSIFETVKRLNMPNATERIERSNYIFNREVNI